MSKVEYYMTAEAAPRVWPRYATNGFGHNTYTNVVICKYVYHH